MVKRFVNRPHHYQFIVFIGLSLLFSGVLLVASDLTRVRLLNLSLIVSHCIARLRDVRFGEIASGDNRGPAHRCAGSIPPLFVVWPGIASGRRTTGWEVLSLD